MNVLHPAQERHATTQAVASIVHRQSSVVGSFQRDWHLVYSRAPVLLRRSLYQRWCCCVHDLGFVCPQSSRSNVQILECFAIQRCSQLCLQQRTIVQYDVTTPKSALTIHRWRLQKLTLASQEVQLKIPRRFTFYEHVGTFTRDSEVNRWMCHVIS